MTYSIIGADTVAVIGGGVGIPVDTPMRCARCLDRIQVEVAEQAEPLALAALMVLWTGRV